MKATPTERDSLGVIEVPAERLRSAQTQPAFDQFGISDQRMPAPIDHALALVKAAGVRVTGVLRLLP